MTFAAQLAIIGKTKRVNMMNNDAVIKKLIDKIKERGANLQQRDDDTERNAIECANAIEYLKTEYDILQDRATESAKTINPLQRKMFKFDISQQVWFLKEDKVRTGYIRVRQFTESLGALNAEGVGYWHSTENNFAAIYSFSPAFIGTNPEWQLLESELFASKTELLESL